MSDRISVGATVGCPQYIWQEQGNISYSGSGIAHVKIDEHADEEEIGSGEKEKGARQKRAGRRVFAYRPYPAFTPPFPPHRGPNLLAIILSVPCSCREGFLPLISLGNRT